VRWSAPEALDEHKFSEKSDVWSFGVVLYELYTRAELPYKGLSNQRVWVDVTSGVRLSQPDGCPDKVYGLMRRCWASASQDRPTFEEIVNRLLQWHDPDPDSHDNINDAQQKTMSASLSNAYADNDDHQPAVAARVSTALTDLSAYEYTDSSTGKSPPILETNLGGNYEYASGPPAGAVSSSPAGDAGTDVHAIGSQELVEHMHPTQASNSEASAADALLLPSTAEKPVERARSAAEEGKCCQGQEGMRFNMIL
jgi:serine/threonine protein kinase